MPARNRLRIENFRPNLRQTQRTLCARGRSQSRRRIHALPQIDFPDRNSRFSVEVDKQPSRPLLYLHGRIPPLFQGAQPRLVPRSQYRHAGFRPLETLHRKLEAQIRKPIQQRLRIHDRPLRRLRTYLPRTLGARRLPRLVVDEQLLQRLFHGREDRHGSRPSGRTPIPRSVQRFVGVVSQQDRIVDRIPYFQSTQEKIVRQQLVLPPRSPTDSNHPPHEHRFRIVIFQPYP